MGLGCGVAESKAKLLTVVEVMAYPKDLLICFVSFAGNEDYIAWGSEAASGGNGAASIHIGKALCLLLGSEAGHHFVYDGLGIFASGIVTCEDE